MTDLDADRGYVENVDGPSPRVAAAAIRDAMEAIELERPDLAAQLRTLLKRLEEEPA